MLLPSFILANQANGKASHQEGLHSVTAGCQYTPPFPSSYLKNMSAKNVTMQEGDAESISTTAPPAYSRRAPQLSPVRTIVFAFSCLGVIYSDIGTSPLYVISTIFPPTESAPSKDDVIGVISAIIWSISLLPLLKYVSCRP